MCAPRAGGRDCLECHKAAQKAYRDRQKARHAKNAIIAAGVLAAVEASENHNTSKGIDNGQETGRGSGGQES